MFEYLTGNKLITEKVLGYINYLDIIGIRLK